MIKTTLTLLALCAAATIHAATQPNIIWLMAEDIGTDLACYGMKGVETPNLDQLAQNGVKFTNTYCTNPICSPSRSAMMTGVHQNIINAQHHRSNRNLPLPEPYKPITHWLREAGYTTILGHRGVFEKGRKIDCNFKTQTTGPWDGKTQFGLFDKVDEFTAEDQPFFNQIQLKVTHRGDWWKDIRQQSKHPVQTSEIEMPPYMPDDPAVKLDWCRYLDQIEYMDAEVGMIMKELEEKGIAENTIVIFIGDNGRCNIRGKGYLYDPGLHIPLIVHGPAGLQPGATDPRLVSTIDISATILKLAGAEMPAYLDGIPLDSAEQRQYIYSARDLWDEILEQSRAINTGRFKYIKNYRPETPWDAHQGYLEFYRPAVHRARALLAEGKLNKTQAAFFAPAKPAEELYDLERDPHETNNLALDPEYKNALETTRAFLAQWQTQNRDRGLDPIDWSQVSKPNATALLQWVKETMPDRYQAMLDGEEIGFQTLAKQYKAEQAKAK